MLNIEHLTKTYGGKAAVQDLSLHIRPGEICAFIGHNGAGKTTTLKCCCGIQQFDSGRITVDGISVQDDPLECKRRLAYLPDNPDLYEYMTGIQYLNFIADIFAVGARERAERIRSYGDQFDLTQDLAQPISAYSHGMKQKLAIISALLHEPKLILMDEPFVGLDPLAAHQLKTLMRRFCDGGGYQAGYQAARELVAENPGMQALFCATDMLALGAQDGLRDAAAPLPAIVGFDDIPQADWQPYQLTTVQQNTALLAHHAVDLLMTRIARFSLPSRHREVPVKLIIRHSAK